MESFMDHSLDVFYYSMTGATPTQSDICTTNPCHDSSDTCTGSCESNGYVCTCADSDRYGQNCDNRDGGWTEWTYWTDCFQSCNEQTRTRTCTNPTPLGTGTDCVGDASETRPCSDEYPTCAEHFGYEFEDLSDACDAFDNVQDISIDECIEYCQNEIECVGVVYVDTSCKSLEGNIKLIKHIKSYLVVLYIQFY